MVQSLHDPPRKLVPRPHAIPDGIPFFDEELQVGQSPAHRTMAHEVSAVLAVLAKEVGLRLLSDEPVWYFHPETDEQRTFYGDLVLARPVDTRSITAESLLLVIEVVSTNDRRKELKDLRFQKLLNEKNGVPEFGLAFPELTDKRALTWHRLVDGAYEEQIVAPGGSVASSSVPGLELRVLPRKEWTSGYKFDVYFRGELRPRIAGERARAEAEAARAETEAARAETEAARAETEAARAETERVRAQTERVRAEKYAAKLRAAGIDPDE